MIYLEELKKALQGFVDSVNQIRRDDTSFFSSIQNRPALKTAFARAGIDWRIPSGIPERMDGSLFADAGRNGTFSVKECVLFALESALAPHIRVQDCSNGKQHWLVWVDGGSVNMDGTRQRFSAEGNTERAALKNLLSALVENLGGISAFEPRVIQNMEGVFNGARKNAGDYQLIRPLEPVFA